MKFRKLVLECGIIAASVAVVSVPSAVSVSAAEIASGTWKTEAGQDNSGSSEFMQDLQEKSEEAAAAEVAAAEASSAENGSAEETSEWENKLLVVVEEDSSLTIRAEAGTDADVVGKIYRGSVAEVVEKGEEWSRIVSGDVEGYVKNEYCVFSGEAEAQAEIICDTVATVTADGVRLRTEATTESSVCAVVDTGDTLTVWKDAETAAESEEADAADTETGTQDAQMGEQAAADAQTGEQAAADAQMGEQAAADVQIGTQTAADVQSGTQAATDEQSGSQDNADAETGAQDASAGTDAETQSADAGSGSGEETQNEGWVAVEYGDTVAYISAAYVDVELQTGEALSMEEIYAEQAAQEAAAQQAAAENAASSETVAVSTGTAVSATADDTTLLAALIQCEAGRESYDGQLAVGAVVMNRVKSGSFPNSISGVIYQSGQFTPASNGRLSQVLSSGGITSSCYSAAQAAISGDDNTGGATYFHAGSGNGTVIGNQVFY
ncbi:MAG: cell wall hydrolase [Lachnospiraceae bacterium]|nr:cell wall hydrolase [Lachnospiraceae bacterium]